jgi:cbb3-type cytochrome oxidase subunit 3
VEALTLTLFASVVLAFAAVLFFAWNVRGKSHEHTEHLSLLPLDDEASVPAPGAPKGTPPCS